MGFDYFINNAPLDRVIDGLYSLTEDGYYTRVGAVVYHNNAWREWLGAPSQHEVFLIAWKHYAV